jgi:PAS domain S-box-containing protein
MEHGEEIGPEPQGAIGDVRARASSQENSRVAGVIARAAEAIARASDPEQVFDAIVEQTVLLGAASAHVLAADEGRRVLTLIRARRIPDDFLTRLRRVSFDAPLLAAQTARTRRLHVFDRVDEIPDELVMAHELVDRTGAGALLSMPLIAGGRLWGVLTWTLARPRKHTAVDLAALDALGDLFAVALEHAQSRQRLLEEIAERRRVEQALARSEARFRRLIERAPDVIFRFRPGTPPAFELVSPALERLAGHPPSALLDDPELLLRIAHPDDRNILTAFLRSPDVLEGSLVFRVRHRAGMLRWVELRGTPVLGPKGELLAMEGAIQDVTARVRASEDRERMVERIAAEGEWLRVMVQTSPAAVLMVSAEGRMTLNALAEEILGGSLSLEGDQLRYEGEVRHPDGRRVEVSELPLFRALQGETVQGAEFLIRRPDGQERWVNSSAAPIRMPQGRLSGAVAMFNDVTRLKELERLREEWTSLIAHDLRQPLTLILAHTGLAARGLHAGEALRHLEHVRASARRAERMISDLLDVSRLESRRLELTVQPVQLGQWFPKVVQRLQSAATDRPIALELPPEPLAVLADPDRLEQILGNLIGNAVKYGEQQTPIQVAVRSEAGAVRISVANRGAGIPAQEVPGLFDRFRRSHGARTGRVGGLGLGLYIVRGLVEAHRGEVIVHSVPGETTTFSFTLPHAPGPTGPSTR